MQERTFAVIGANAITPGAEVVERTATRKSTRKRLGREEVDVMVMNSAAAFGGVYCVSEWRRG